MKTIGNYYRIYPGSKSAFAQQCREQGFIDVDWLINQDLNNHLPDDWKSFNHQFIPVYLEADPTKTRVAAGLACGMLHTVCKGMLIGDIVLCQDGSGGYYAGEVASDYYYYAEGAK